MSELQTGASGWVRYSQAFLFSMVNPGGLGPTSMPLFKSHEHAIYCEAGSGPTFGVRRDLHISGNANINYDSYTFLGCSYQCPTGQSAKTLAEKSSLENACSLSASLLFDFSFLDTLWRTMSP